MSSAVLATAMLLHFRTPFGVQLEANISTPVQQSGEQSDAGVQVRPRSFGGMRASAEVFNKYCSGCHGGLDGTTGRAPNLFDERWLKSISDPQIEQIVRHGIPKTEMGGFTSSQLSDRQIFELIAFLRNRSDITAPKPVFVADPDGKVIRSEKQNFKLEVLAHGLETPWGLAFLPDNRLLITERPGRLRVYSNGKLSEPVSGMPVPRSEQDAGYLDITVHPRYAENGWIYLAYSEILPGFKQPPADEISQSSQIPSNTVIARGRINAKNEWIDGEVIFRSPPGLYATSASHYGCRFLWDKQGHLFFTLGERGDMKNAQDLTNKNSLGKIHRINDDGSAPKDNPFVNRPGIDTTIWSYGHRNPEGLAFDPITGELWESEHGPAGGDEINVIKPGHNYGWGVISMGIQPGITERLHEGMDQPVAYYTPSIAPSAISFYTGNRFPAWKDTSLFVCALKGQQLRRLEINGEKIMHQEVLFSEFGRVRDIVQGPDGYFYLALQNPTGMNGLLISASTPGSIVRLIPAE